jgi:hypothetical protein
VILRRLVALGILCFMALLTPALVRAADPAPAPTGDAVAPQASGPSLALSPSAGFPNNKFSASYTDGQPCPQGAQAALIWDGQPIAVASHPQQSGKRCSAGFSNQVPPQGLNQPGDHVVQAELVTCSSPQSCAPVGGSDASAAYTVYAQETAPPTAPPATAPPVPAATLPPAPTDTPTPKPTPMPTPLRIADPGTFAPYDCRNGIPDLTPCPSPVGAIAALVTGPADPAPPPATSTPAPAPAPDSAGLPMGTLALLAGILAFLLVAVVVLGVRQGRAAHRTRRSSGGRGRRAGRAG